MRDVWERLEKVLPGESVAGLRGGATEEAIKEAERVMGVEFTQEMAESFREHDGQSERSPGMVQGWQLLSLAEVVHEWRIWKELYDSGEFKGQESDANGHSVSDWWNPGWIPVTTNGGGDSHCVDLAPAAGGKRGQIILMVHDDGTRELVAAGYREWLIDLAERLEADKKIAGSATQAGEGVPSMETFMGMMGRSIKEEGVQAVLKGQALTKSERAVLDVFVLRGEAGGFELQYTKAGVIETVFLYVRATDKYAAYTGELIKGIKAADGYEEVRRILGPPMARKEGGGPTEPPVRWFDFFPMHKGRMQVKYLREGKGIEQVVISRMG